jgi:methylamine dehydrogenase heavy chain
LRAALAGAACAAIATGAAAQAFQPETVGVATLAPATPHRIYLSDVTIGHIADGKMWVIDGETFNVQGMVATGMAGQTALSPDRREIYVATTYFTRLNRGERVDQVDVYDATTLALKQEIAIPPKHAQALPYKGTLRASSDGRFLFVQNATPASTVSVVDLKAGQFVGEINTPGCWAVLPSASVPGRFATICGDGTLLTVTLDEAGRQAEQQRSAAFFDPDSDAVFIAAEPIGDRYHFVSFKGRILVADIAGSVARFEEPWSLVSKADAKQGWRPGGYQPIAIHADTGRLFVSMHPKGREGSHKDIAHEIWAFDIASRKRIARAPGNNAVSLAVTRGPGAPTLYAFDPTKAGIVAYRSGAKSLKVLRRGDGLGETPTQLELH